MRRGSVKRMHLRVRRDGSVYVSAPYRASMKDIERFVTDNRDWIERTVKRVTEADHGYADGETVPVLGEEYVLHIIISPDERVAIEGPDLFVFTSDDPEPVMREFHRDIIKRVAPQYLDRWTRETGLRYSEFRTKYMRTKWGTCNTREKRIWLSTKLAEKPPECIEYVVLHEICHLRYADHGPGFKAMLDAYMPDWRERCRRLNPRVNP